MANLRQQQTSLEKVCKGPLGTSRPKSIKRKGEGCRNAPGGFHLHSAVCSNGLFKSRKDKDNGMGIDASGDPFRTAEGKKKKFMFKYHLGLARKLRGKRGDRRGRKERLLPRTKQSTRISVYRLSPRTGSGAKDWSDRLRWKSKRGETRRFMKDRDVQEAAVAPATTWSAQECASHKSHMDGGKN